MAAPYLPEKLIRTLNAKGVKAIENVAVEEDKCSALWSNSCCFYIRKGGCKRVMHAS